MKYGLIETFFNDPSDCVQFCVKLNSLRRVSQGAKSIATLKKIDHNKWGYLLIWLPDPDIGVGELIKPFTPSLENFRKFNQGCAELARRLEILLDTQDPSKVPVEPPPFGDLTYKDESYDIEKFVREVESKENGVQKPNSDLSSSYWVLIHETGTNGKTRVYVDEWSIKQNKTSRLAWVKFYTDPPGRDKLHDLNVWEVLVLFEYDCNNKRSRGHQMITHYDNGVSPTLSIGSEWSSITTESEEIIFNYVCQYKYP